MKRLPTPAATQHLFEALRSLERRRAPSQPKQIDDLEARLLDAIRRDSTGTTSPDGFPTSTLGGGGGAGTHASPVETASLALLAGGATDRHHELTAKAVGALDDAVVALNTLRSTLASIADLTSDSGPAPRHCQHCTPFLPAAEAREVHRRGNVGNRLPKHIDLCEPCYWFVTRSAPAGSELGELPSPNQIRHHNETGTWRIRHTKRATLQHHASPGK